MSLYKQCIPVYIKYLKNLSGILEKAVKFADEKGMKHSELLEFRLISDMRALPYQVTSCSNTVKFVVSRLGAAPDTYFADDETTFPELQTRIEKTIQLLQAVDPKGMDAKQNEPVLMKTARMGSFKFESGQQYVDNYATPNFHFHLTTAYCILRHLGVPISAFNYLGKETFVKAEEEEEKK